MGNHNVQIPIGECQKSFLYGGHGVKVQIRVVDQQVVMGRLPVHHSHPFIAKLPEIADKAPVIPDGKDYGHGQVGPGEQKVVFGTRRPGQSRKYVHLAGPELVFGLHPAPDHRTDEPGVQSLFEAGQQIRNQASGPAILGIFKRRPVRAKGHLEIGVPLKPVMVGSR